MMPDSEAALYPSSRLEGLLDGRSTSLASDRFEDPPLLFEVLPAVDFLLFFAVFELCVLFFLVLLFEAVFFFFVSAMDYRFVTICPIMATRPMTRQYIEKYSYLFLLTTFIMTRIAK